ncbi:MAG: MFS transporter [Corynebacteriales bacterium]|nr:MFS transporter [Mycobacteriales bacterium]
MATLSTMFASLTNRNYRLFFFGQLISLTGSWAQIVAQDWLVLDITNNSASALATVTALQFAPTILFTLYAGLLADRLDKRKMLIVIMATMATAAIIMGVLVISGHIALWHVFIFATITGVGNAFEKPIRQVFVPELVEPKQLINALSLNSAVFNSARLIGPALGGLLIAVAGTGWAFVVNGVAYIPVVISMFVMRMSEMNPHPRTERARGQLMVGLRFLRGRPDLLLVMSMGAVMGALALNINQLLSLRARVDLGVSAAHLGLLSSALAVGALMGALLGAKSKGSPRPGVQLGCAAGFGATAVLLALAPNAFATAIVLVPMGAFLIGHNTVANARMQLGTPAELRGRVMSVYMLVFFGGTPLGALVLGGVATATSVQFSLILLGISVIGASAIFAAARAYRHGARIWLGREPHLHLHIERPKYDTVRIPVTFPRVAR